MQPIKEIKHLLRFLTLVPLKYSHLMLHFHQSLWRQLRCYFRQFDGMLQGDGTYFLAGSIGSACPTGSSWALVVLQGLVPSLAQGRRCPGAGQRSAPSWFLKTSSAL